MFEKFKKTENVYCCQKCGTVQALLKISHDQKVNCPFCNSVMRNLQRSVSGFESRIDKKYKTWQDVVRKQYAKPKHRDDELYKKREIEDLNKEKSSNFSNTEQKKKQDELRKLKSNSNVSKPVKPIVKCLYCGSENVRKISGTERMVSVLTLGFLSNKINKSFKCDDCGGTF